MFGVSCVTFNMAKFQTYPHIYTKFIFIHYSTTWLVEVCLRFHHLVSDHFIIRSDYILLKDILRCKSLQSTWPVGNKIYVHLYKHNSNNRCLQNSRWQIRAINFFLLFETDSIIVLLKELEVLSCTFWLAASNIKLTSNIKVSPIYVLCIKIKVWRHYHTVCNDYSSPTSAQALLPNHHIPCISPSERIGCPISQKMYY